MSHFSLRDLFWLVSAAALGCAWWVETRKSHALVQANQAGQKREQELQISRDTLDQQYRHLYAHLHCTDYLDVL